MDDHAIPSDKDLQFWLAAVEYQFIERKGKNDRGGWLRTIVAFANSNPIGSPGVLYIGVNDDGSVPGMSRKELEDTMKSIGKYVEEHTWPPITAIPIPVEKDGKACLAIVVPYSSQRPHFAGRAYVRRGTETIEASATQYEELIASRNTKTREIVRWLGKDITFITRTTHGPGYSQHITTGRVIVHTCGPLFVTINFVRTMGDQKVESFPLHAIEISFDNEKNRLTIYNYGDR